MSEYADYRRELLEDAGTCVVLYERGRRDASVKSQYENDVKRLELELSELKETSDHMSNIYKNIKAQRTFKKYLRPRDTGSR